VFFSAAVNKYIIVLIHCTRSG